MQPPSESMGQHVFTYLPVNHIPQLPFMIQGDFELPASREDIQQDSVWKME